MNRNPRTPVHELLSKDRLAGERERRAGDKNDAHTTPTQRQAEIGRAVLALPTLSWLPLVLSLFFFVYICPGSTCILFLPLFRGRSSGGCGKRCAGENERLQKWGQINRTTNGTPVAVLFLFSVLLDVNVPHRTRGNNGALFYLLCAEFTKLCSEKHKKR